MVRKRRADKKFGIDVREDLAGQSSEFLDFVEKYSLFLIIGAVVLVVAVTGGIV